MIKKSVEKFHDFKKSLVFFATIISVGIYYVGTDFIAPSRNIISMFIEPLIGADYEFHSGNKLGNYHFVGELFEKSSRSRNSNYRVKNISTPGAAHNLFTVSSKPNSFGLIQEDTVESSMLGQKFIENNIVKISHLYTEKLHILYWPIDIAFSDSDEKTSKMKDSLILKYKRTSTELDRVLLEDIEFRDDLRERAMTDSLYYLSHPRVYMNLGTPNGGSRFIVHALLNQAGIESFEEREKNLEFSEAVEAFKKRNIQVIFFYSGTPLPKIQDLLDRGAKLMNVKAVDFIKVLKKDYSILSRPAKFSDEYKGAENIGTIGSRATLIASSDVSNKALVEILSNFKSYVGTFDTENGRLVAAGGRVLPLNREEIKNASKVVEAKYARDKDELIRNFLLFVVSWVAGTLLVLRVINGVISHFKKYRYYSDIQEVAKNTALIDEKATDFYSVVELLQSSYRDLVRLKSLFAEDYSTGGITDDSLKFLDARVDSVLQDIRQSTVKYLIQFKCSEYTFYAEYGQRIADLLSSGLIDVGFVDKWIPQVAIDSNGLQAEDAQQKKSSEKKKGIFS